MGRSGYAIAALAAAAGVWGCGGSVGPGTQAPYTCTQAPGPPRVTVTYQASAPLGHAELTADDVADAVERICEGFGGEGAVLVEAAEGKRIRVVVSGPVGDTERLRRDAEPPELFFYELEPNVVPLEPRASEVTPATLAQQSTASLYSAVELASRQGSSCEGVCTDPRGSLYLFERSSRQFVAGPEPTRAALLATSATRGLPEDERKLFEVPPGTIVVQDLENPDYPDSAPRYLLLRDRPALSGADVVDPEPSTDAQTDLPTVIFGFTEEGRRSFQAVTRRIAQHGAASGLGQRYAFAIVLDRRILSRPVIDPAENPDGIDGTTGVQISSAFTQADAEALARALVDASLPVQVDVVDVEVEE